MFIGQVTKSPQRFSLIWCDNNELNIPNERFHIQTSFSSWYVKYTLKTALYLWTYTTFRLYELSDIDQQVFLHHIQVSNLLGGLPTLPPKEKEKDLTTIMNVQAIKICLFLDALKRYTWSALFMSKIMKKTVSNLTIMIVLHCYPPM